MKLSRCPACAVALCLGLLAAGEVDAEPGEVRPDAAVRYRTEEHVYLDRGQAAGLSMGQRLSVKREGHTIGAIEVVFVARHSATARIVSETLPIAAADLLVPHTAGTVTNAFGGRALRGSIVGRSLSADAMSVVATSRPATNAAEEKPLRGFSVRSPVSGTRAQATVSRPLARSSGVVSVLWEGFQDSIGGRDVNDLTGRVSLSLRDIGGKPYALRVRMRMRQVSRGLVGSPVIPTSETRNRLYEISFKHQPPDGRFSYVLGRVGVSPFVGMGYLDGGLVQVAVAPNVRVGAFGGAVPAVDGIRFDFAQTKYGAFLRLGSALRSSSKRVNVVLAGVREQYAKGTRDFASVETSFSSSRWSLFQRAELDFRLPSADGLDGGTGLSSVSLSATYRLAGRSRLYAGYHTRRDPLPGAVRFDSQLFDVLFRSSLRAGVNLGLGRSGTVSVGGSLRTRQGTDERAYAGNLGVTWRFDRLWAGATLLVYDGSGSSGFVATARLSGSISRDIRFLAYYSHFRSSHDLMSNAQTNHRAGADVTFDLRGGLFMRGGLELGRGTALEGTRAVAEAGFRF